MFPPPLPQHDVHDVDLSIRGLREGLPRARPSDTGHRRRGMTTLHVRRQRKGAKVNCRSGSGESKHLGHLRQEKREKAECLYRQHETPKADRTWQRYHPSRTERQSRNHLYRWSLQVYRMFHRMRRQHDWEIASGLRGAMQAGGVKEDVTCAPSFEGPAETEVCATLFSLSDRVAVGLIRVEGPPLPSLPSI